MQLAIEIKNLDKLEEAFRKAPAIAEPIIQRALQASSAIFAKNTLKDDPVPWRTGNLLHSFRSIEGRLETRWLPTAHYAIYVHEGTSRGIKPNPFMKTILDKSVDDINAIFVQALDQLSQAITS